MLIEIFCSQIHIIIIKNILINFIKIYIPLLLAYTESISKLSSKIKKLIPIG